MKKIELIVLVICWLIANTSVGQKNVLFVGAQAGVSVSNGIETGYLYFENTEVLISPCYNVYFQYGLTNALSINMGIGMERKGFEKTLVAVDRNRNPIGDLNTKQIFNYLIIPLNIEYQWGKRFKYFVGFGGYLGFLASQKLVLEEFGSFQGSEESQMYYYHGTDYGLDVGVGCSIPLKSAFSVTIRLNGNLGLKNIVKKPTFFYEEASIYSFNGLLGLRYQISRK